MIEHRKYERLALDFYLQVFNEKNNRPFGQIVNVSVGGMLLSCTETMEEDGDYLLWMEAPKVSGYVDRIVFQAKCVWIKYLEGKEEMYCGLQFIDPSEHATIFFNELLEFIQSRYKKNESSQPQVY